MMKIHHTVNFLRIPQTSLKETPSMFEYNLSQIIGVRKWLRKKHKEIKLISMKSSSG